MSSVDQLLEQFIEAYRSDAGTDSAAYLEQVEGLDREELGSLISAFLERAPRPSVDAEAMAGTPAGDLLDRVLRELETVGTSWSALLPALRNRLQLTRSQLVSRLSELLDATGSEQKVAAYYHRMERDQLDPRGISDKVFGALSNVLEESADTLRRAGESFSPGAAETAEIFARHAGPPDPEYAIEADGTAPAEASAARPEPRDHVDDLFTGGLDADR